MQCSNSAGYIYVYESAVQGIYEREYVCIFVCVNVYLLASASFYTYTRSHTQTYTHTLSHTMLTVWH